jgi:hypothetical protein
VGEAREFLEAAPPASLEIARGGRGVAFVT